MCTARAGTKITSFGYEPCDDENYWKNLDVTIDVQTNVTNELHQLTLRVGPNQSTLYSKLKSVDIRNLGSYFLKISSTPRFFR